MSTDHILSEVELSGLFAISEGPMNYARAIEQAVVKKLQQQPQPKPAPPALQAIINVACELGWIKDTDIPTPEAQAAGWASTLIIDKMRQLNGNPHEDSAISKGWFEILEVVKANTTDFDVRQANARRTTGMHIGSFVALEISQAFKQKKSPSATVIYDELLSIGKELGVVESPELYEQCIEKIKALQTSIAMRQASLEKLGMMLGLEPGPKMMHPIWMKIREMRETIGTYQTRVQTLGNAFKLETGDDVFARVTDIGIRLNSPHMKDVHATREKFREMRDAALLHQMQMQKIRIAFDLDAGDDVVACLEKKAIVMENAIDDLVEIEQHIMKNMPKRARLFRNPDNKKEVILNTLTYMNARIEKRDSDLIAIGGALALEDKSAACARFAINEITRLQALARTSRNVGGVVFEKSPNTINIQGYNAAGDLVGMCTRSTSDVSRDMGIMDAILLFDNAVQRGVTIEAHKVGNVWISSEKPLSPLFFMGPMGKPHNDRDSL